MLVQCPECNKDVSDSAEVCPHCGYRLLGRENLRRCERCDADIVPTRNPHDPFCLSCPLCGKAICGTIPRGLIYGLIAAAIGALVILAIAASNR